MGYLDDQSMSDNAYLAYQAGLKPKSKWTKDDIISEVVQYGVWQVDELRKYTKAVLFSYFLHCDEWHHTSKMFNITDFYELDYDAATTHDVNDLEKWAQRIMNAQEKAKCSAETNVIKGHVVYEEWVGTRNHGRFKRFEAPCLIVGNQAYTKDGRKRLDGRHVMRVERYERAPRGQAQVYKDLIQELPRSIKAKM